MVQFVFIQIIIRNKQTQNNKRKIANLNFRIIKLKHHSLDYLGEKATRQNHFDRFCMNTKNEKLI